MDTLLHIDSSLRTHDQSISKSIAKTFVDTWKNKNTTNAILYRDVGINPPDYITQEWVKAAFTPVHARSSEQNQLLVYSDELINEVRQANILVISSPMYNYGLPAQLKAWFDQVIRINQTFDFDLSRGDFPLQPLLSGKTLITITSCGEFGFEAGGIRADANHLQPHLRTLGKYLGAETTHQIQAEYQEFDDDRHRKSVDNAHLEAEKLALMLTQ